MKSLSILFAVAFGSSMMFVGCGTEGDNSPMLSSADAQDEEALGLPGYCQVNAQNKLTGKCFSTTCSQGIKITCAVGASVDPSKNVSACSTILNTAKVCQAM